MPLASATKDSQFLGGRDQRILCLLGRLQQVVEQALPHAERGQDDFHGSMILMTSASTAAPISRVTGDCATTPDGIERVDIAFGDHSCKNSSARRATERSGA